MTDQTPKRRGPFLRIAAFFVLVLAILLAAAALHRPGTPLPPRWNVFEPLNVADDVTPLTQWKLDWATSDPALCRQVLDQAAEFRAMDDLIVDENCGITGRITLRKLSDARLDPIETACATALRLTMWEVHDLQPSAYELFGQAIARIRHIGSYNCRAIRNSTRWSTHATASSIDITGFDLEDGTRIRLLKDWDAADAKASFLRQARDTSCDWFGTTLGPEYNALHADHFHLQNSGWGTCR